MKKLLVLGGSGLFGGNLVMDLSNKFEIHYTYCQHKVNFKDAHSYNIDISDKKSVNELVKKINPDLIINTVALTDLSLCEKNPMLAEKIIVIGAENVVLATKKYGSKLVHISTNYVFDGKNKMYQEKDKPIPINEYSKKKLKADLVVKKMDKNSIIIRSAIYGWSIFNKGSVAEFIINKLKKNEVVNVFSDVYFTPILVNHLSDIIPKMYEKDLKGIFHIGSEERISRLNFAHKIADIFNLDKELIKPVSVDDFVKGYKIPKDTSLSTIKIRKALNIKIFKVEEGLIKMKQLMTNGYLAELKKVADCNFD